MVAKLPAEDSLAAYANSEPPALEDGVAWRRVGHNGTSKLVSVRVTRIDEAGKIAAAINSRCQCDIVKVVPKPNGPESLKLLEIDGEAHIELFRQHFPKAVVMMIPQGTGNGRG